MCGFAGYLDPRLEDGEDAMRARAAAMAECLRHRGPDDSGSWADPAAGLALGFRRLSIIDLSAAGHQPMVSADGRYVMVYNGEVYNFAALRRELEALGRRFRGNSDSEVVLEAIAQWGLEPALERFVGMFALALWDREQRELRLVRDRLGIKPLYYGWAGGVFLFASEPAALRAHPAFEAGIDREALALYLLRACVPAPRSMWAGMRQLAPGHLVALRAGERSLPEPEPYWSLRETLALARQNPFRGSLDEATEALEEHLTAAVAERLVSDVPLGVFLSGGIDSSTVTALMCKTASGPVRSFSIGFNEADYDEAVDARLVAEHLGTEHHELILEPADALAVIPDLARIFDEPFADSSQIPTYLVSRMARQHVTVCLSGDGGDETFGGYNRYLWCDAVWRRTGHWPMTLRRGLGGAFRLLSPGAWDGLFAALGPVLPAALRQRNPGDKLHKLAAVMAADGIEAMYKGVVDHWPDVGRLMPGASEPASLLSQPENWAELPDFVQQMMYLDAMSYLPDDILTKVDRASMAVSLEARVPLIDHRVVAFAWSLPLEHRVGAGQGKRVLRRLLDRHVPRRLVERPKMGFAIPLQAWLRGPLREWAEELLAEPALVEGGYLDPAPIRELWRQHLGGRRNWQHQLWDVLMFQAWRREYAI